VSERPQLAALRLTPFRSATVESFLSAAFSSLLAFSISLGSDLMI
jgi:hypothetical protein